MKWTRGPPVGRGSTATVSTAVIHPDGDTVAVKSVELTRWKLLQSEQRIHSAIRCPYIIEYRGQDVTVENGKLMYNIFMEFASLGSLAESIAKSSCDLYTISLFTRSILKGIEYLHSKGIIHCDIKPSNVLVMADGCVKISDLGCARLADDVEKSDWHVAGTPIYMAPEVARGEQQGYPADVWALGCTVIEMATGQAPWPGVSDPVSAMYRVGFSGQVPEIPEFLSGEAKDFVGKCLRLYPEQRWSVKELLQHPFVKAANTDLVTELRTGHGFCSVSPTSVLMNSDLCDPKWDELCCSSTRDEGEDPNRVLKSSAERIRNLIGPGSDMNGLSGLDPGDESRWVTVRSGNVDEDSGKACFSNRVELESLSFDVENFENTFLTYFGHDFSRINSLQFERDVHGFQFPCITICKTNYFECVTLFSSQIPIDTEVHDSCTNNCKNPNSD